VPNEVSVYKPIYWIERFGEEDAIKVTPEQYEGLEKVLLDSDVKFIKVGDEIINSASIKRVFRQARQDHISKFEESGSNPLYRDWCQAGMTGRFNEWVNKLGER
jgi:hypothetical protein